MDFEATVIRERSDMLNRVLLVDDSKSARFALRKMLERDGYDVDMAESAEEAIGYLNENKPDVIFMDHFMPGMDGFEAARLIKSQPANAEIPIVMCTSKDDVDYLEQAKANGAVDILSKPATPSQLSDVMDKLTPAHISKSSAEHASPASFESPSHSASETMKANVPVLSEVVIPSRGAGHISEIANTMDADKIMNERIEKALQAKLPELRESVLNNFDKIVKSMLKGYIEEAMIEARQQFAAVTESEARIVAQQVSTETVSTIVHAQAQTLREQMQREMNEQLAEIYSTIGELKANQYLKKASPELRQEISRQACEATEELVNEKLADVSETTSDIAKKISREVATKTADEFRQETEAKIAKGIEAGLESARQVAAEVVWEKMSEFQNTTGKSMAKAGRLTQISLACSLVAVLGLIFLMA